MNVSDLKGVALDWAVAKCQGVNVEICYFDNETLLGFFIDFPDYSNFIPYSPSTNWQYGGEIIERENISVRKLWDGGQPRPSSSTDAWRADLDFKDGVMTLGKLSQYGGTPLEAAMRCYVQSELGDEIEIPKEML